jgi:asparagine synthase (glutamine-hydrolysing)
MLAAIGRTDLATRSFVDPRVGIALGYVRQFETVASPAGFEWHETDLTVATMDGFLVGARGGKADDDNGSPAATRVITQSLEANETRFPEGLQGHFCLATWSRQTKTLRLVRDPLGTKNLYCFHDATTGLSVFSSELKGLLAHPGVSRRVDPDALAGAMAFGYVPAPLCLFEGVRKLLPGEILELDQRCTPSARRYWSMPPYAPQKADAAELASQARDILLERFGKYVAGHGCVGVFLSGGVDSTVALGVLKLLGASELRTYAFGFRVGRSRFAEDLGWAQRAADALGVACRHVVIEAGHDPSSALTTVWRSFDDPVLSPNVHTRFLLAQAAQREGVPMCIGGTTGGSLFNTVSDRSLAKLTQEAGELPAAELLAYRTNRVFRFDEMGELLVESPESPQQVALDVVKLYADGIDAEGVGEHLNLAKLLLTGTEKSVATQDRSARLAGIDMRHPFRDVELLEFCRSIPAELKGRHSEEKSKHILKLAFQDVLPDSIATRKQIGYPSYYWSGGEVDGLVERLLSREAVERAGMFRPDRVQQILDEDRGGPKKSAGKRTWALLNMQAWHTLHVDGRDVL